MNPRWREDPILLQVLLGVLLFLFLLMLSYVLSLIQPRLGGMDLFARANSTRTSIALTSNALLGPFPTATGPTRTPSYTPSITPTPTVTASATPTSTPIRYFIDTATPRTLVPGLEQTTIAGTPVRPTSTSAPPTEPRRPTATSIPATDPPRQPTNPPQATNPPPQQPTNPPKKPTKTPKPPKPTKTPKHDVIVACFEPLQCSYFFSEKYSAASFGSPSADQGYPVSSQGSAYHPDT